MAKIKFIAVRSGTLLAPIDEDGENAIKSLSNEESYSVTIYVDRSLKMNGAYFSLLNFVWENMPEKFQAKVPKNKFYVLLKELQCRFTEIKVSEKTSIKEYESLSFEKMNEARFHEVFKEDVDFIISDILIPMGMQDFVEQLVLQFERTLIKYKLDK